MQSNSCDLEIKNIGHLGLIAAVFKELRLVERIDEILPKTSKNVKISHGQAVMAMVMQGLGYSSNRLYMTPDFFSQAALGSLFEEGVLDPSHLSPFTLARTLDAIYEFGPVHFLSTLCMKIITENRLLKKLIFMDTTSFAVTGRRYKKSGSIKLTHGYSKDNRSDLRQFVYLLATTSDALPLYAQAHSGNAADSEIFEKTLLEIEHRLGRHLKNKFFVIDSSLYSRKFLQNKNINGYWITRVPESVKDCRLLLEKSQTDRYWKEIDENYKYIEVKGAKYGGRSQKWIIVNHRPSMYKELANFKKKLEKSEKSMLKSKLRLCSQLFKDKVDCLEAVRELRKKYPYFIFTQTVLGQYKKLRGKRNKVLIGYKVHLDHRKNTVKIAKHENKKGKFVIACNCLNKDKITVSEIIAAYRSRNASIEGCFKFLKDRKKCLNQIHLKKVSRIESMLMVMSLILFVNNYAQKKIRDSLAKTGKRIPNQLGQPIKKPTFAWVSHLMRNVTQVYFSSKKQIIYKICGIDSVQKTIISAFGKFAAPIYGFP